MSEDGINKLFEPLGVRSVVVATLQEAADAIDAASVDGLQLAAISNAGLTGTRRRLTFVPQSAFQKTTQH